MIKRNKWDFFLYISRKDGDLLFVINSMYTVLSLSPAFLLFLGQYGTLHFSRMNSTLSPLPPHSAVLEPVSATKPIKNNFKTTIHIITQQTRKP